MRLSAAFDNRAQNLGVFFWRKVSGSVVSALQGVYEGGGGAYDLALCRKNGLLQAWFRDEVSAWAPLGEDQDHPALKGNVQVGVEGHAYEGGATVGATFDALLFADPGEASCADAVAQLGSQLPAAQK